MRRLQFSIIPRAYSTSSAQTISESKKSAVYCSNIQITSHGRNGNIREAESLFRRLPEKSVVTYTAMLSAYAKNGQIKNARKLFDEMPQRTVSTWNAMITAYVRNKNRLDGVEEAFRLFERMPVRNAVSHTVMMMGFIGAGRLDDAERLFGSTPLKWRDSFCSNVMMNGYLMVGKLEEAVRVFEGMVEKNVVSCSTMVDGYCKNGRVSEARKLFDVMGESRNEFTWCCMIDGYMKSGNFEDGFQLFLEMRREGRVRIEPTILTVIFESCGMIGRDREGCQVHGFVSHLGLEFDVVLYNSMIGMYSRFGCIDEARNLFNRMNKRDAVSWNSLIFGYVQAGRIEEAYELFERMYHKDSVSWTTLITGFANRGLTEKCVSLFHDMPDRDGVAWTALISGFVNNGENKEAIAWFVQMVCNATRPDAVTLCSMLRASASLASLNLGSQMHAFVVKLNMECDISIQNSLVSMYSKCGNVDSAYKIFKSITRPSVVSFNSMITGFAHNGYGEEALYLFRKLVDGGHDPTDVTFIGVLSACTHAGLVETGWQYFKSMSTLFNVEPSPDHYACMVDLLGRSGLLNEAIKLIESMPFEPHIGVWGALLGASRTHMRPDIAKLASKKMLQLEPKNATAYVVLSDIYHYLGKRRDEEEMRLSQRLLGIKKSPGCSWITVKEKVKLFLSGDKYHDNFEEIKPTLGTLMWEMTQFYDWLDIY